MNSDCVVLFLLPFPSSFEILYSGDLQLTPAFHMVCWPCPLAHNVENMFFCKWMVRWQECGFCTSNMVAGLVIYLMGNFLWRSHVDDVPVIQLPLLHWTQLKQVWKQMGDNVVNHRQKDRALEYSWPNKGLTRKNMCWQHFLGHASRITLKHFHRVQASISRRCSYSPSTIGSSFPVTPA